MINNYILKLTRLIFGLIISFISVQTYAVIDNNAPVVKLRSSCLEAGRTLDNCFTDVPSVNTWIHTLRKPTQSTPLLVDIGPGSFPVGSTSFNCSGSEYITLRGSGRTNTVLTRGDSIIVIQIDNSCHLNVQDLSINNIGGVAAISANTLGPDSTALTTWTNVDVESTAYSWVESCPAGNTTRKHKHFWIGSKLTSEARPEYPWFGFAKTYFSCGENWFYSTEITARQDSPFTGVPQVNALMVAGETHVYGGVIRALAGTGVTLPPAAHTHNDGATGLVAIYVATGMAHIHGAGIDVISAEPIQGAAIFAEGDGAVHANQSSFNLQNAGGAKHSRIIKLDQAHIHSPYLWENHPEAPSVISVTGADMAVVTNTSDKQPHLVIYSESCPSHWYDTALAACR